MRSLVRKLLIGSNAAIGVLLIARSAFASHTKMPIPPWALNVPTKLRDSLFWKKLDWKTANSYSNEYANWIVDNNLNPKPSYSDFRAAYLQIGKSMGVPPILIRAHHYKESYPYVAPLIVAKSTSATGIAQMISETSAILGVPLIYQLYWKTGIWSTAKLLLRNGWDLGTNLPTEEQIEDAYLKAGTDEEPGWFRANRRYVGKATSGRERLLIAISSTFDDLTDKNMKFWNKR